MLRKKKFVILIIGLVLLIAIIIWYRNRVALEREDFLEYKAAFAAEMQFSVRGNEEYNAWLVFRFNRSNPDVDNFRDVVFVLSPEEADAFDEDIFVAWPQNEIHPGRGVGSWGGTEDQIRFITYRARDRNPSIDFRDYGLPGNEITVVDTVENWEIVSEINNKYRH
jgi:hypothetical protein